MTKLTPPAPQNIKRRREFLAIHPEYYGKEKTRAELLKLMLREIEIEKARSKSSRAVSLESKQETVMPQAKISPKTKFIERVKRFFMPQKTG